MWNYRQKIDLDTTIKISPACHDWQSACWFTLKGLKMWRFLFGDRSLGFQLALSFFLVGVGFVTVTSIRRKWKERFLPIATLHEEIEALPEVENEANPALETLPPEDQVNQDLNAPLVSKTSIPPTETLESATLNVEEIKPETVEPVPEQPATKTRTKNNKREIKPKQPKTKIPMPNIKTPKEASIVKKDQHQPTQKMSPLKRPPSLPKPVGKPMPRQTVSTTRDPNENPDDQGASNQADVRRRQTSVRTANWKN